MVFSYCPMFIGCGSINCWKSIERSKDYTITHLEQILLYVFSPKVTEPNQLGQLKVRCIMTIWFTWLTLQNMNSDAKSVQKIPNLNISSVTSIFIQKLAFYRIKQIQNNCE